MSGRGREDDRGESALGSLRARPAADDGRLHGGGSGDVRGAPGGLPAACPLPECEHVPALERGVDDLRHPVVIPVSVTHATDGTTAAGRTTRRDW